MWPALLLLAGCGALESAGDGVKQIAGWAAGTLAEVTICPAGVIECGHVFECTGTEADTPSGFVEICISDDDPDAFDEIEEMYGMCEPTPRHQGLCSWCPDSGRGCNAFSGCWGCP